MERARYHRDQAELCLEMARQISDPVAADLVREAAVRHSARAVEIEKSARAATKSIAFRPGDDFSDGFYCRAIRTGIGEVLRNQLIPTEPTPEYLLKGLRALDRAKGGNNRH
jgi:hypothetical protein